MSLIEEALRRIQEGPARRAQEPPASSSSPPEALPSPATSATPESRPSSAMTPWTSFALAWLGLGVLGYGLVAVAFWTYRIMLTNIRSAEPTSHAPLAQSLQTQSPLLERTPMISVPAVITPVATVDLALLPQEPLTREPPPPVLTLNGVVEGVGETFALINGRIVRLGETVEGATLVDVNKDAARLRWRDQELVLRTTR